MLVIALFIKLDSRGPIFFTQKRIGKNKKIFLCYKFRTMNIDAQEHLKSLLISNVEDRKEWNDRRKLRKDPRVTIIGRLLRRSSLDELPQLFNVLKGEMSIVGPRPVVEDEIQKYYKEKAGLYYSVLPGITGLWQISGRTKTAYQSRVDLDSWYARNWNIGTDMIIVLKTLPAVIKRTGAY